MGRPAWVERANGAETPKAEPPRSGRGATTDAWRSYAQSLGHRVPPGMGRHDLIALVDAGPPTQPERPSGPVETKVRQDIGALVTSHPMGEALAEVSYTLARALDKGAGLATAAVSRELRANLVELAGMAEAGEDDLEELLSEATPGDDTEGDE